MNNNANSFDFLELGQAIQDAREKQRITREELAEELGISARHLQSIEKEGQNPSFPLFIQLVTMFHISVGQYIHPGNQRLFSSSTFSGYAVNCLHIEIAAHTNEMKRFPCPQSPPFYRCRTIQAEMPPSVCLYDKCQIICHNHIH